MLKGWTFNFPWRRASTRKIRKIVLGICAMDKKARSKPMKEILSRLPEDLFEIVVFGDDCILNQPVEAWPPVEVLITFFSNKFPTDKALQYIALRKPFLINDLSMEATLKDRRQVYDLMVSIGIDVPAHVFVTRPDPDSGLADTNVIEEFDEYIVANGVQINKPLVEKPVDAEDHNIYIYYPVSAGGGSKRLFRKVHDRSSEFYPGLNDVRREGSYIYEEFVITQGTDVKVYTVGPEYAHAEARKSPVVDGRVKRDGEGCEVRYPVILSQIEKEMARKIVVAFKQTVCGFDILRVHGKSYCCDVNGESLLQFVSLFVSLSLSHTHTISLNVGWLVVLFVQGFRLSRILASTTKTRRRY
jgi:inositol-hexakisphosphate/diphosphoinositol-pentakisphosphate 1-kinase